MPSPQNHAASLKVGRGNSVAKLLQYSDGREAGTGHGISQIHGRAALALVTGQCRHRDTSMPKIFSI